MKLKILIFLALVLSISTSCSSSKSTAEEKDVSLSTLYHKTEKANLYYKLPSGWSEIKDNYEQLFDLWLVGGKGKSTITFIPIQFENDLIEDNTFEQLRILLNVETNIKKTSLQNYAILEKPKEFGNNNIKFISMKYLDDGDTKRSVIFGKSNSFYECIAYFENDYAPTEVELNSLFDIQQRVLHSVQMK